jgi:hypothetical protein
LELTEEKPYSSLKAVHSIDRPNYLQYYFVANFQGGGHQGQHLHIYYMHLAYEINSSHSAAERHIMLELFGITEMLPP